MPRSLRSAAVAAALLASPAAAQVLPGQSIATVTFTSQPGEMYLVDNDLGTVTPLTISTTLANEGPNCVLMDTPVTGFVGTNTGGNVYSIVVTGNMVLETLLNTTPTAGGNVAELTIVGGELYFCTQTAGVIGTLQSVPLAGGPVTTRLDLATLGATGLANAVTSIGSKVYVATFNSSPTSTATSPGELFEYDVPTNTGRLVMNLPPGGFQPVNNPWNTGIVNAEPDPLVPGSVMLQGVYGELLSIDPVAGTITSQVWTGLYNAGGNALASGAVNSFSWDPVAQDWVVGTRNGSVERWVHNQQAESKILGVGSTTSASVTGIHYMAHATGSDVSYGAGCAGNANWIPTDSSFGPPAAGNSNFRLGLFGANPGDAVILAMGFQNVVFGGLLLPLDGTPFGAPGCFLRTDSVSTRFAIAGGSGAGQGQVTVPLPIPANVVGLTLYRQWIELQVTPTNALGIVVSNARQLTVQ